MIPEEMVRKGEIYVLCRTVNPDTVVKYRSSQIVSQN
jgi:hypothetical protein